MALMILQIDFPVDRSTSTEQTAELIPLAQLIAEAPGLIWKIWTENPETKEAGGIYLFADEPSLDAYLEVHTQRLKGLGIEQINAKKFQVNEPLTQITHGNLKR